VRAPGDGSEQVRAAVAGDPAAAAALWDAHGPRAYGFCRRVLGDADAAADAAQDAFLLALQADSTEDFDVALLRAARQTSFELLAAGRGAGRRPGTGLGPAAGRLRPQQRAALALSALDGLSYADIAAVLGVGVEAVPALLARARMRLHDELHGTALAAAAVRSPDCEDVVPLLAAAVDGERDAADAAWADPHVLRCPTCPRTHRAMLEAAATYAAWSSAAPPSWLRNATLADVGAEAQGFAPVPVAPGPSPRRARRRAAGARVTPRPGLAAALLGATLVTAGFAALMVAGFDALRPDGPVHGGARLGDIAGSVQVANVPAHRASRPAASHAPRRARRAHRTQRAQRVSFVPVAAVRRLPARAPSVPSHRAPARPHSPAPRPKPSRAPRPAPAAPARPAPPVANAPVPASAAAPADETPTTTTVAASAPASPAPATPGSAPATAPAQKTAAPAATPSLPAGNGWHGGDRDGRSHRRPCGPHGRYDR
jgi:DNA-directed RNA polymerase specialized sigma24 family protein